MTIAHPAVSAVAPGSAPSAASAALRWAALPCDSGAAPETPTTSGTSAPEGALAGSMLGALAPRPFVCTASMAELTWAAAVAIVC